MDEPAASDELGVLDAPEEPDASPALTMPTGPDAPAGPDAPTVPAEPGDERAAPDGPDMDSAWAHPVHLHEPHHRKAGRRGSVAVGAVLALAGLLFTANAHLAQAANVRGPQDLAGLVERETARVDQLAGQVDALRARVSALTDQLNTAGPVGDPAQQAQTEFEAGGVAAEGPGITVQLTDAPAAVGRPADAVPDDLLVHQQDVQAVIDALWAGGAEVMSIQDQRVTATTAVRCVGNVLLLQGITYSPPYVIKAIGDPRSLTRALSASPDIRTYLKYVKSVGLGWSVARESSVAIKAGVVLDLQYARAPTAVGATSGSATAGVPIPVLTPAASSSSSRTP